MVSLPRHRADYGWIAIAVGVIVYDLLSSDENSLSSAMDGYLECHPWLTRGIVVVTTLHLLNIIDHLGLRRADPFVLTLGFVAHLKGRHRGLTLSVLDSNV